MSNQDSNFKNITWPSRYLFVLVTFKYFDIKMNVPNQKTLKKETKGRNRVMPIEASAIRAQCGNLG